MPRTAPALLLLLAAPAAAAEPKAHRDIPYAEPRHERRTLDVYLRDPDDNGVELYRDRPPEEWPRTPTGELAMFTRRLDLNGLLREVEQTQDAPAVEEGTRDL